MSNRLHLAALSLAVAGCTAVAPAASGRTLAPAPPALRVVDDASRPAERVDLGAVPLLAPEAERQRVMPPGIEFFGLENTSDAVVQFDGWVLRLDPGSATVNLRHGPVGAAQRAPTGPNTAVSLAEPWPIPPGMTQHATLALQPLEEGAVSGALELLEGDAVVMRVPFRAQVERPGALDGR